MADLNTATYLKNNVGPALTKAMAALAVAQPNDAVDFLGKWLQRYADTEEARIESAKEQERLAEERAKVQEELKEAAARKQKIEEEKEAKVKKAATLIESFQGASQWSESFDSDLVSVAKESGNARQVYLGWVDEDIGEGESAVVRYSNVAGPDDAQNELMMGSVLPGGAGVTMKVFEEKQPPEAGEGEGTVPEGFRKFEAVWVPEVTDDPQVHYFDLTRLGSYLAVPLIYNTYYHEDALAAAIDHETKTSEVLAANEEAKANPPDEGDLVLQELPELQMPGKPVKMVLCLDTLCQANSGDGGMEDAAGKPPTEALYALCDAAAAARTRCEQLAICEQAKTLLSEDRKAELLDTYTKATEEAEGTRASNAAAALGELGEDASDAAKQLVELEHAFHKARSVFVAMSSYVIEMASYVLVEKEVLGTAAACLLLILRSKDQVFIRNKDPLNGVRSLSWSQVRKLVDPEMIVGVKNLDVKGPRKNLQTAQKVEFLNGLVPADMDEAKAGETRSGAAFQALLLFVKAALDYRSADVAMRKEEHQKKLRVAEDEGGEMPPPLAQIDEDFVD